MSLNEIHVDTPPAAVWGLLADPPSYEEWVVGNKGGRTVVRMEERGAGGPVKVLWPLLEPLVTLRNAETLRRLKRLAESRERTEQRRR
jgi:hypothetical protein